MDTNVLLCLHGWGGSKESFTELKAALAGKEVTLLIPDLPGFGEEPDPASAWTVDDYAAWVEEWVRSHQYPLGPLAVIGHSHGGRIAMKLALRKHLPITHLFLCAAAGIRRPRHLKRLIGLTLAKGGKYLFSIPGLRGLEPAGKKLLYRLVRVHDYERASAVMRDTLIRVTAEDFRPYLSQIATPTDLFWGEDDRMTVIADARELNAGIKGSRLHTYPGVRHAVHRTKAPEIAHILTERLHLS